MKKIALILVCAGIGKRFSKKIDKALLKIENKPLFYYTLKNFINIKQIKQVVLVLRKKNFNIAKRLLSKFNNNFLIKIVEGGKERQDSVINGLTVLDSEITDVLIHDGARPFVRKKLITAIIKNLQYFDAVICGVKVKDALKLEKEGFVKSTLNRDNIFYIQTPQGFKKDLIIRAYKNLGNKKVFDDAQAVELLGEKVKIIEGDPLNIKITYPQDIFLLKAIANLHKKY
ncbi:MAG: 2-C-methyl-D-erythritol 4-phosphate cytidylyltransferase [Candidatus Omnitrophica bacterium]|nr:2-C-methyl-D-erythritol 4-phosphate cytidylyltransferase [Candidatus Omnitrophota bacterium]MCM8831689.1 2-C-methyl-D-erythritol 4-phosphate cytidylyltransferase [Candidatus Omnitrophota bacterium]